MKKYKYLGKTTTQKFIIKGINVYKYEWVLEGRCVIVMDPTNKKARSLSVHKITVGDRDLLFVSGMLSDGSIGFFEYEE